MLTRLEVANKVRDNLDDVGVTYYSSTDINDSIQDGYNRYATLTGGILKGTYIPKPKVPYLNVASILADYMYPVGIYNWSYNRWLDPISIRQLDAMRWDWELWTGEMSHFSVIDFRRILLVPYLSTASGTIFFLFKSKPPELTDGLVLQIPKQYENLVEYYATADLLEQGREYTKAAEYWNEWNVGIPKARDIVTNFARADLVHVMEPYFPMGKYTKASDGDDEMHIDNEIPAGTIDGVNTVFTLVSSPSPSNSLVLTLNGVVLYQGVGYTLTGNTITLTVAPLAPTIEDPTGDILRAWYRVG